MKCHEARRQVDLFMDGELAVPDNMKVLEHLNLCRPCAGVYEGEKALRGTLKSKLGSERAPEGLAARLSQALRPAAVERRPARGIWGRLAAAVLFFALASAIVFTSPTELPSAFAASAVAKHAETRDGFCGDPGPDRMCPCVGCCPDRTDPMGKFFKRHVPYSVCAHDLSGMGFEFAGACVWEHRGKPVCWTVQRNAQGRTITHALVATPLARDAEAMTLRANGRPVVMVPASARAAADGPAGEKTCVFIFDAEEDRDRFLAAIQKR